MRLIDLIDMNRPSRMRKHENMRKVNFKFVVRLFDVAPRQRSLGSELFEIF